MHRGIGLDRPVSLMALGTDPSCPAGTLKVAPGDKSRGTEAFEEGATSSSPFSWRAVSVWELCVLLVGRNLEGEERRKTNFWSRLEQFLLMV